MYVIAIYIDRNHPLVRTFPIIVQYFHFFPININSYRKIKTTNVLKCNLYFNLIMSKYIQIAWIDIIQITRVIKMFVISYS